MAKLPSSKTIKELAELLSETGLTEIESRPAICELKWRGKALPLAPLCRKLQQRLLRLKAAPEPKEAAPAPAPADHPGGVKSPMVGTAYLAPEPGSANFVKVGDTVSEGQTILIVEAMKTMNPISAPRAGKVTQILISNEQPVEFDEVLMIIE